jgi:methionyl-tRNA synthetase
MTNRYLDGERPAPGSAGALAAAAAEAVRAYGERLEACLLHDALASLWTLVEAANRLVDAEKPWELAKASKNGDEAATQRLRDVLGDLLEACRLIGLAVAPFMPATAPRVLTQLGYGYPYGTDGNGGPPILDELGWGIRAAEPGRVTAPEPLFPRLETEAAVETGTVETA